MNILHSHMNTDSTVFPTLLRQNAINLFKENMIKINWWPMETPPPDHGAYYSVWRGNSWSWSSCGRRCSCGSCPCALQHASSSSSCPAGSWHMWDTHTGLGRHHHIDETGSPAWSSDLKEPIIETRSYCHYAQSFSVLPSLSLKLTMRCRVFPKFSDPIWKNGRNISLNFQYTTLFISKQSLIQIWPTAFGGSGTIYKDFKLCCCPRG